MLRRKESVMHVCGGEKLGQGRHLQGHGFLEGTAQPSALGGYTGKRRLFALRMDPDMVG